MRSSIVGFVRVRSCQLSSIMQVGDCVAVTPSSRVLAVQREESRFIGNEGNLGAFRIFNQKDPEFAADEPYSLHIRNDQPNIQVGFLDIYGLSVSAVLQIGSNRIIDAENRTKHIRQLLEGERPVSTADAVVDAEAQNGASP